MDASIRNFKDFLQIYNLLSESCFNSCIDNLNSRTLEDREIQCVEDCASKFIKLNHRFMAAYVECQQILVNKRIKEAEEKIAITEPVIQNAFVEDKSDTITDFLTKTAEITNEL